MKEFKVIDKTHRHITLTEFERDLTQERIVDFSKVELSERQQDDLIDEFCDSFNVICQDEKGDFYEVLFVCQYSSAETYVNVPVIYRKCRKKVK